MENVVMLIYGICRAVCIVGYKLVGVGVFLIPIMIIVGKTWRRNITLLRFSRWAYRVVNHCTLTSGQELWLAYNKELVFEQAISRGDWATARRIKRLAGNMDALFEYLVEITKAESPLIKE